MAYGPSVMGLSAVAPDLLAGFTKEERQLLAAVVATPEADAPRLAYATWLERFEPSEAEHIRHQIATPQVQYVATPRQAAQLAPWGAADLLSQRGFVCSASLSGRSFLSHGAILLQVVPLHTLQLVAVQHLLPELLACTHVGQLQTLNLGLCNFSPAQWQAITQASWAPHLACLRVPDKDVSLVCRYALQAPFAVRGQAE